MNKKGQMSVEAVLLIVVFLGAALFVSNQFRENGVLAQFVHGPWDRLSGMVKYGVWLPDETAKGLHPLNRVNSVQGESEN